MKKSRFTDQEIAFTLQQAEAGTPVAEVCRKMASRTKAVVLANGSAHAAAFRVAQGRAHELPDAVPLLNCLLGVPR